MNNRQLELTLLIRRSLFGILLFAGISTVNAAQQVHLLGFVESLCPDEPHCYELRVEADYIELAASRIFVRYDRKTLIFDPENYELTLEQSDIVGGSHLRLLMDPDSGRGDFAYQATVIWVGD